MPLFGLTGSRSHDSGSWGVRALDPLGKGLGKGMDLSGRATLLF